MAKCRQFMGDDRGFVVVTGEPPLVRGPFSNVGESLWTQQGGICRDLELDYMRCATRVGGLHAERVCSKQLDDFMECTRRTKTMARFAAIARERKRQGKDLLPSPAKDTIFHSQVTNH